MTQHWLWGLPVAPVDPPEPKAVCAECGGLADVPLGVVASGYVPLCSDACADKRHKRRAGDGPAPRMSF